MAYLVANDFTLGISSLHEQSFFIVLPFSRVTKAERGRQESGGLKHWQFQGEYAVLVKLTLGSMSIGIDRICILVTASL